jgi:hypothetical protein
VNASFKLNEQLTNVVCRDMNRVRRIDEVDKA